MTDKTDENVEMAKEPRLDERFGMKTDRSFQSSLALKAGVTATVIGIAVILCVKTPEKPKFEHQGIKSPEASQMGQGNSDIKWDSYSAAAESQQIKDQNQKRKSNVVTRLPGLQKIDRKRTAEIPPGSMVKAILLTGASNGPVRVEITEPLEVQGETLVPAGAKLLGAGTSGEDRLNVRFSKIVFTDGTFDNIQAQAADAEDKIAGLHGSKIGSYAMKYAAAIGLNFVGGMAEGLQDHDVVNQQVVNRADAKNALLNGTSRATMELAQNTMSNMKSKPPVIEVPAGKEILVIFDGDK